MKSFKQYITESEQTEKSSYPWTQKKHGGWWHPSGKHFTWKWDIDGGNHHVSQIVRSPQLFGLNHDDIHNIITSNDPLNIKWKKHYGWNDDQLKKKIAGGIIDNYPPIQNAAHEKGWVAVRNAPHISLPNLALMGYEPGLRHAADLASLHIPPSKLETEQFHLYDASKDEHFYLTGMDQIERYIKKGIIPS